MVTNGIIEALTEISGLLLLSKNNCIYYDLIINI